ncbi:MAG: carbonic anhydrase [Candidatus Paceibacterota bacterium]
MERILTFPRKINMGHYEADACLVWCFDVRFNPALEEFIKHKGLNPAKVDCVRTAGGAKGLAEGRSRRDSALGDIEKSVLFHRAPLIILANHRDCADYGIKFETPEKERDFHKRELNEARASVEKFLDRNALRNIAIETIFVDDEGILTPKR